MTVQHTDPTTAEGRTARLDEIRTALADLDDVVDGVTGVKGRYGWRFSGTAQHVNMYTDLKLLLSELEAAQARLDKGRAVLTDRIAEWKAEQARWRSMPTSAMDRQDWLAAEFQQHRLGEVEDLLDKFDAATVGLGEEGTDAVPADAAPVIVYGASDDLIELRGTVDDELAANYGRPTTVRVDIVTGERVWLQVEYDPDGTGEWRITPVSGDGQTLRDGHELVTIVPARGEDAGDDEHGCPGRSDKAVVRGGIAVEEEGTGKY